MHGRNSFCLEKHISLYQCVLRKRYVDDTTHCFNLGCQKGFYKDSVGNEKCVPCPSNSASNTDRTGCICNEGYFQSSNVADCEGMLIIDNGVVPIITE